MPSSSPLAEKLGGLNLPKGGVNGYVGVRKLRNGYQGYTPKKTHTTSEFPTAQEAAAALAAKKRDIQLGLVEEVERKPRVAPGACNLRMRLRPASRQATFADLVLSDRIVADALSVYQAPKAVVASASPLVVGFGGFEQRLRALPVAQVVRQVVPVKLITSEQAALLLALGRQRVLAQPVA